MGEVLAGRSAVLVIAGTDSSGGAGLTRDVRVLADFGIDALYAVTAVTAQSNERVAVIHDVPPDIIHAQIAIAFQAREVAAVKIGMLGNRATVDAVVASVQAHPGVPIVLDPVLLSSSGHTLLDADGRAAMLKSLFPLTTVITPNIPEAAVILNDGPGTSEAALIGHARRLLALGPRSVLLKGGHADGPEAVDLLIWADHEVHRFASPRIRSSRRGTGCALATAIAARLASGVPLIEACQEAKRYVSQMLSNGRA